MYKELALCDGTVLNIEDSTLIEVEHLGLQSQLVENEETLETLFERSLQAINEAILWTKAVERLQTSVSFQRQIGRVDVKMFALELRDKSQLVWVNSGYVLNAPGAFMMRFMANNYDSQIAQNPLQPVVKRAMASVDLLSLGFYTEAFITLFSLVDDLTQNVVKAGLAKRGLSPKEQKSLLMAIKEQRLSHFVEIVVKVAGWSGLSESNRPLAQRLAAANGLRNRVMHDSSRLQLGESMEHCNTLLEVIDWLRGNPFGAVIPPFPVLALARSEFVHVRPKPAQPEENTQPKPGPTE